MCMRKRSRMPLHRLVRRSALAFFAGAAALHVSPVFAQPAGSLLRCELRPVLIETFDELRISQNKIGWARWTAHTPWGGDFGDARFADPGAAGPFRADNGILSITASKDAGGTWSSGLIAAADASGAGAGARFGYFEVRMKMPAGPGTWPAFWLMSLKPTKDYDTKVEIDVIEYYGHDPAHFHSVIHVWYKDESRSRGYGTKTRVAAGSLVDAFHTYGVDVSPRELVFFMDGRQVWRQPAPPELDGQLYPIVNLALGSGWPIDETPNPSRLLVDYVHVYERASAAEDCPRGPP